MSSPRQSSSPIHWNYSQFDDSTYKIHGSTLLFMLVLGSILLLVTSLVVFLFFRGRRDCFLLPPRQPPAAADLPVHSAHQPTPPPRGLDTVAINSLPTVLCKGNWNETECCICLGTFVEGEKVRVLPHCDHRFHSECVDKWLKTQSSCPLCRDCLRVNSPV